MNLHPPDDPIERSGVRKIFTPHQPVGPELFSGREDEVNRVLEHLRTPGRHALLFGQRGVGKTSLAYHVVRTLKRESGWDDLCSERCEPASSFAALVAKALVGSKLEPYLRHFTEAYERGGGAEVKIPFARAGVDTQRTTSRTFAPPEVSPASVAAELESRRVLILIDEADVLESSETQQGLALFAKYLSDTSPSKLLIVGVAETGEQLVGTHQSLKRCLGYTKLDLMKPHELEQIISRGAAQLELEFSAAVTNTIVDLSAGDPYFTHLLALKCAEGAIRGRYRKVHVGDLTAAVQDAVRDAEHSVRADYSKAVRQSTAKKTIIRAAATLTNEVFSIGDVARQLQQDRKVVGRHLRALTSTDPPLLRRGEPGHYSFCDPRMPGFLRIAASAEEGFRGTALRFFSLVRENSTKIGHSELLEAKKRLKELAPRLSQAQKVELLFLAEVVHGSLERGAARIKKIERITYRDPTGAERTHEIDWTQSEVFPELRWDLKLGDDRVSVHDCYLKAIVELSGSQRNAIFSGIEIVDSVLR